jgi:membrane-associated phospholipid phosphatase
LPDEPTLTSVGVTLVFAYLALSAVLIAIGFLLTHLLAPVRHWDDHVIRRMASHRSAGWNRVSHIGTLLADTLGVVVVAAAVTLVALVVRRGRDAAIFVCGLAVELAVFLTVNYSVVRPRPAAPHLGPTPSTYSFPSGHVAATLALYGGIAVLVGTRTRAVLVRVAAWAVAGVIVAWVGLSRVYEAEHHPTDVMAGLVLGAGALASAVVALRLGPAAGPDQRRADRRDHGPDHGRDHPDHAASAPWETAPAGGGAPAPRGARR